MSINQVIERLFVYGILCPGRPNEHVLTKIGGEFEPAYACGRLHQKGWGATMGYPAVVIEAEGERVDGFEFSSNNLAAFGR